MGNAPFLVFCAIVSAVVAAFPDTVYLKNGQKMEGIVLKKTSEGVLLQLSFGEMQIEAQEIDSVQVSGQDNEALKVVWKQEKNESRKNSERVKKRDAMPKPAPYEPEEILLFTTSWCPSCMRAKAFFSANNIAVTEYDIEKSETGRQLHAAYGTEAIPVIDIDKNVFVGFKMQEIIQVLRRYRRYQ